MNPLSFIEPPLRPDAPLSNTTPVRQFRPSDDVAHVLDWLASPIPEDPAQDLAQLSGELAALGRARLEDALYHRILDLFFDRAHRLSHALKVRLTEASLPLGKELRAMAALLITVHEASRQATSGSCLTPSVSSTASVAMSALLSPAPYVA